MQSLAANSKGEASIKRRYFGVDVTLVGNIQI